MLTIHLRINDEATGKPTPVRLRVTGPDRREYAPFGRLTIFAVGKNQDVGGHLRQGDERFSYIDGTCEISLPAGVPLRVQATKGPEYTPLDEEVVLGPGQMALRFAIRRWSDVRTEGWHPGDTRSHFLSPHSALLEAVAEDVAVVNLLARAQPESWLDGHVYPTLANLTAFSGQSPALQSDSALVAVNTLNVHPVLGSVGLLHAHRAVYPLTFGGEEATDDWSVCDWCDQCHRKKGLTVWARPFEGGGGEALVALVLGKIDAIELDAAPRKVPLLPWWYRLLNCGFRVPLVGGSGKDSNSVALGSPRTYAKLPPGESLTYTSWIEAVRAGRCFATFGPLLTLDVAGRGPGESVTDAGPLPVRATAASRTPFDRLEVVRNGEVIAEAPAIATDGRWTASLELDHTAGPGWLAARCSGLAHSSPVFVGESPRGDTGPFHRLVLQTREWVAEHGRFAEPKKKQHLLELIDAALDRLRAS